MLICRNWQAENRININIGAFPTFSNINETLVGHAHCGKLP